MSNPLRPLSINITENKPLVSISVITYNHENFIEQALQGFFKQEVNFAYEILINDDASTDRTQEIISSYQKKYPNVIKPLFQERNKYSQGERGMNCRYNYPRARGKYIAICDGDDYWQDPLKLQKQVDFLEKNSSYVMTFHNTKEIDEKGIVKDYEGLKVFRKDRSSAELQQGVYIFTSTICFRNVIEPYPPEIFEVVNEDTFTISLLGKYGGAKYLADIEPAFYRIQSKGVWSVLKNEDRSLHRLTTYQKLKEYYQRIGDINMVEFYTLKLRNVHLWLVQYAIESGNYKHAFDYMKHFKYYSKDSFFIKNYLLIKAGLKGVLRYNS